MMFRSAFLIAGLLSVLLASAQPGQAVDRDIVPAGAVMLVQGGDAAWREADRARRELQRQQRIVECQNQVLAQQSRYASQAEFLRARQACSGTR